MAKATGEFNTMRTIQLSGAFFTLVLVLAVVFASASEASPDRPEATFTDVNFTKNEFRRLNERQLHALRNNRDYFNAFTIEGFSRGIAPMILRMATAETGPTRRLLGDMCRLTARADRLRRLQEELDWIRRMNARLTQTLKDLRSKPDNFVNRARREVAEARLESLQEYKKELRKWFRHPSIGTG